MRPADALLDVAGARFIAPASALLLPVAFLALPSPRMVLRPLTPAVDRTDFAGDRPADLLAARASVFGAALPAALDGDFTALRVPAPGVAAAAVILLDLPTARPTAFFAVALRDVVFFEAALAAAVPALAGLVAVDFLAIALLLAGVAFPATFLAATFLTGAFLTAAFLATFLAGVLLLADLLAPVALLADLRGLVVAMRHLPS